MIGACLFCLVVIRPGSIAAEEFAVSTADDIAAAMQLAQPGDALVMTNGTWLDQTIDFAGIGNSGAPITLRAQTAGGVRLTGTSSLSISGSHLVVDGLNFQDGTVGNMQSIVQFRGSMGDASHSRLTNTQIKNTNPTNSSDRAFWVSLYGTDNRVDHSSFQDQTNSGVTLVAWLDGRETNHRVDSNYFADRERGNENGFETIRIGTSAQSNTNARVVVENNLFERVDGEIEIISNKSNDNIYRYNTIRESAGTITLRHGDRATVEGNFILGGGKSDTGGVRVIGEDHRVINNYIADVGDRAGGAISISAGVPDTPLAGYKQVRNALIGNNTVVNADGPAVKFDHGFGEDDRLLLAEDVTLANNLIYSTQSPLFEGQEGSGWTWASNIAFGASLGIDSREGILEVDPQLVQGADGLWRLSSGSPAIDGGVAISGVTTDMDGQARIGLLDIGADERSVEQIVRKPLTADVVGTTWGRPSAPGAGAFVALQAEEFTQLLDPDNDGDVWAIVQDVTALNGAAIEAPAGSRTDLASDPHETLALYDITFGEAGLYTAYYRARGFSGSTDSFFTPTDFDEDPDQVETLSPDSDFIWELGSSFMISESDIGVPLEFRIGRREGLAQLDAIVFHMDDSLTDEQLDALFVPETGSLVLLLGGMILSFNRSEKRKRKVTR